MTACGLRAAAGLSRLATSQVAALPQPAQNTRQCSDVSTPIEQFGGCNSFGGSRAHIVSAVQPVQPLGGFFGVAASTCDSHRAALGGTLGSEARAQGEGEALGDVPRREIVLDMGDRREID